MEGSLYDGSSTQTPNKLPRNFPERIEEAVSDSQQSSDHRFSEVSAPNVDLMQQQPLHMAVKRTPFGQTEETKKGINNTGSKLNSRYDKISEFAETEQSQFPNPFAEKITSFSDKVKTDQKENLMKEKGGHALRQGALMSMTSGAMAQKKDLDEEDLMFPYASSREN